MNDQQKLELIISARNQTQAALSSVSNQISTITSRVLNLKTAVIGLGGVYAIDRLTRRFENLSSVQDKAEAGMTQAMRSMGRYTDELHDRMLRIAYDIQGKTTFGDEAIIQGQKFLLTYKDITDDVLPRAAAAMADLAALMGGDTTQAANMLGKASMGMTGELRRVGITVDEDTYKTKGFLGVLAEIEQQVRGQAQAIRRTKAGELDYFGNVVGDVQEKIGYFTQSIKVNITKGILPAIQSLDERLAALKKSGQLDEWADEWSRKITDVVNTGIRGLGDVLKKTAEVVRWIEQHKELAEYGLIGWILAGKKGMVAGAAYGAAESYVTSGGLKKDVEGMFAWVDKKLGVSPGGSRVARGRLDSWIALQNERTSAARSLADTLDVLADKMKNYHLTVETAASRARGTSILELRRSQGVMGGSDSAMAEIYDPWHDKLADFTDETRKSFDYLEEMSRETAKNMQHNFSDFFYDGVTRKLETFGDYWKSFTDGLLRVWSDMVSRQVMIWMLGQDYMSGQSSQAGGWVGAIGAAVKAYAASQGSGAGPAHVGAGGTTAYGMHTGGVGAHEASFTRSVPISVFANAPRYHTGIGPNERAAIIRNDEGVFTEGQMQALGLMANRGGGTVNIFQINAVDPKSFGDLVKRNPGAVIGPITQSLKDNKIRTEWKSLLNG